MQSVYRKFLSWIVSLLFCLAVTFAQASSAPSTGPAGTWKIGAPIATYWAGPAMTDAVAEQMAAGGFNLVWCSESELDTAHRHGLRALLNLGINPDKVDDSQELARLGGIIERVRNHPALYAYHIMDEPNASRFPALGRLVAFIRQKDPAHLAYINLFPIYASNDQLGNKGDAEAAYAEHLRQFVQIVKPDLISYDHYHFRVGGDGDQYFLNLEMVRQAALDTGVPFLNIVQACSWDPAMRVPNGDELRWLVYTSLAYGAQGISYYVYCHPGHNGTMALPDGTPTALYHAAKVLNREFVAIAGQVQALRSLGAYHIGAIPQGGASLPERSEFRLELPSAPATKQAAKPAAGFVLGLFGSDAKPTHAVVVNLDYNAEAMVTVVAPGQLEVFDPATGEWSAPAGGGGRAELRLLPGGGRLLRARP